MELTYNCSSVEELDGIATDILNKIPGPRVFALFGEMGSGKTTLVKSLCKALGSSDKVSSPTFSLVNEYLSESKGCIFHFDVYRIKKLEELMDIGYETYFFSDCYVFIEWSEKIIELLPEKSVYVKIRETDTGIREILVQD